MASIPKIDPNELIYQPFVNSTTHLKNKDNFIDIYLHREGGEVLVQEGIPLMKQTIQSLVIDNSDIIFFKSVVNNLDEKIDLDFKFTNASHASDISIYYDTEIKSFSNTILGLATRNAQKNKGWEIFINRPKLPSSKRRRYALLHELGHALGLEHPFSDADGDVVNGITDPYKSSYPEDTVMAYRRPRNGYYNWPQNFSDNDLNALTTIWGEESPEIYFLNKTNSSGDVVKNWFKNSSNLVQQIDVKKSFLTISSHSWSDTIEINRVVKASNFGGLIQAKQSKTALNRSANPREGSVLEGSSGVDTVRGLAAWDVLDGGNGNDLIHGGNGRDIISGGKGSDELHGDFGWNTYRSEKDGEKDLIAIKSDQYLNNWMHGKAGNSPNGEKADFIEGLDEKDEIKIIGVMTADLTFRSINHREINGIGIFAKGTLEAIYTGGDLSLTQITAITTGESSTQWSYRTEEAPPELLS